MGTDRRREDRRKSNSSVHDERRTGERRKGERRQSVRVPLDLWVEEERGAELYFRRTGNLSLGGISFERTIPHTLGTRVRLRFTLPGQEMPLETHGEVVNTPNEKNGLGMGLRFLELAPSDRQRLEEFIAAYVE